MKLNGVKLTWLGHATFKVETPSGDIVLIDPWVMGNPACPPRSKKIAKIDTMLCTHGHFDHIGDAVELAKEHNPTIVGIYELATWMQKSGQDFTLIDVRDHPEVANGMIPGAKHLTRGMLEVNIDQITTDKNKPLVLYCGGGSRSALAADNLRKMGFKNVISLAGGWRAWKESSGS